MGIVAGLDSSPDFTRIVVCDTDTGAVLRQGYAPHPVESPEGGGRPADVDPQAWGGGGGWGGGGWPPRT
ncbi:sugar kinase, partial [Streptomyces carpinensis]